MDIKKQNGQSISQDVDYYYHDYVDYNFENSTDSPATNYPPTLSPIVVPPSPSTEIIQTTLPPKIFNIKNNTNPMKKPPPVPPSPSSSGFTFFGVPLPNLNFNLWGNAGRKANRKEDIEDRPGKTRYKNFPPTEPEIHRGGFIPIPQGEGGFVPIVDPRLTNEKKEKNVTILSVKTPKGQENTTIIKTHDERKRIKHSNFTVEKVERIIAFKKKPEIKDREELSTAATVKNESFFLPTPANFENFPGTRKTIVEESNPDAEETSVSTEIYIGESLEVDEDLKKEVPQEKVASKIIWTTIPSLEPVESGIKETVTASMEVITLKKKKISDAKVLHKETTTIGTTEIYQSTFGEELKEIFILLLIHSNKSRFFFLKVIFNSSLNKIKIYLLELLFCLVENQKITGDFKYFKFEAFKI